MSRFRNLLVLLPARYRCWSPARTVRRVRKALAMSWFNFDANFRGESWRTGADISYLGDHWNDQISSFRCSRR